MKKKFFLLVYSLLLTINQQAMQACSLGFVHIGQKIPVYLPIAVQQVRLFNPEIPIYLLAEERAVAPIKELLYQQNITLIYLDDLQKSPEHLYYLHKVAFQEGFWRYASERFLYLYDFMKQYTIEHLFHIENDVMLYADLTEMLPIFVTNYPGIAAVFDNDIRCIPSFLYFSSAHALRPLAQFFAVNAQTRKNDMVLIAAFNNNNSANVIEHLPIIPSEYKNFHSLINHSRQTTTQAENYSRHVDLFQSIFDGAAIGQYLGGIDTIHQGGGVPGFINESSLFNPADFTYNWKLDEYGRRIPFLIFDMKERGTLTMPINNLHIHSKNLSAFAS